MPIDNQQLFLIKGKLVNLQLKLLEFVLIFSLQNLQ